MPVTIATRNNSTAKKFVLNKRSDTVAVEGVGPDDWILKLICMIRAIFLVLNKTS